MRQFKRVIYLFEEFEFLLSKWLVWKKSKLKNFKKVFQIIKIVEFEIHSKRKEIEISQFVEFLIAQY